MENNDLHIIIGKRNSGSTSFPLTIETEQGGSHKAKLQIGIDNEDFNKELSGIVLGSALYKAMIENNLWFLITDLDAFTRTFFYKGAFLIEIKAPELFQQYWEDIFETPELSFLSDRFTVIRFIDEPSALVVRPFHLPVDLLEFTEISAEGLNLLPGNESLQYYHTTTSKGGKTSDFIDLLSKLKYDIVHLTASAEFRENFTSVLFPCKNETEINPKDLLRLLRRCGVRFFILQETGQRFDALLNFAHYLIHPEGPTILLLKERQIGSSWNLNEIYMDIVHDIPLHQIFQKIPPILDPVLLLVQGGTEVMRISQQAPRLYAALESKLHYLKQLKKTLPVFTESDEIPLSPSVKALIKPEDIHKPARARRGHDLKVSQFRRLKFIDDAIYSLENEIRPKYLLNYANESGALLPLKEAETLNNKIDKYLDEIRPYAKRVVNSWFRQGNQIIDRNESLVTHTSYKYEVQIGAASKKSNIINATAIPEKELARFYSDEGIELVVELFSNDFQIKESPQTLKLPFPPKESNAVTFDIITPQKDCLAQMRVCVYHELNLIQSLMVKAIVGKPKIETKIRGNLAAVDFSLSGSLTDIEQLPLKKLNIAINKSDNGTHSLYIKGKKLRQQFDFGESELKNTVLKTREKLQTICGDKDTGYKYDHNNKGNEKKFVSDIIDMATLGYKLYTKIILGEDWEFEDKLSEALSGSETPIQVASTKSAKYVFPWALVYDKPLTKGNNEVCQQFLTDLKMLQQNGSLGEQKCIKHGCPNKDKREIVCPSGFWGYKHIIEQPISLDANADSINDIQMFIDTRGGNINFLMGISQELNDYNAHVQEINVLGNMNLHLLKTKQEIGIGLQRNDLHLIYFYCHGGRKGSETWLGIGEKNERFIPEDLIAWKVRWSLDHPLVFINGCHTVDATPDDFVDFNSALARCRASGVIGTEISVPEILARHFAVGFLQTFFNNRKVGEAIREQRLTMLKNYNLLGLAYTPYCYSDLEIKH